MGKASRARRARQQALPATQGVPVVPRPRLVPPAPEPADLLRDLRSAAGRARKAERQVSDLVRASRAAGLSWDQIAGATGRNRETLRRTFRE